MDKWMPSCELADDWPSRASSILSLHGAAPVSEIFFDEQAEQSQVKTAIVAKYFESWARVIQGSLASQRRQLKVAYIDLFAGPGRYKDGATSTPLHILEMAVREPKLRDNLVTIFNDKDPANSSSLLKEANALPGIGTLRYKPQIETEEVGEEIVKQFESANLVPSLMFVDPWGYKGLSLRLVNSVLKDWACECVFFFNYNRINMGLANDAVKPHMEALFGEGRADEIRAKLMPLGPERREIVVVEELCEALVNLGGQYIIPFCFKNASGSRTSHHLIFVSKHHLGYKIMKTVMANESSNATAGVASFEYNPASADQPMLSGLLKPLDELGDMLVEKFAGRTLSMIDVFAEHNRLAPGNTENCILRFTDKNYKDTLNKLELGGKITAGKPYALRPTRNGEKTFADDIMVTFLSKQART
jgi:three-Cys-motif partner protein